jgi:hypothetical protein
MEQLVKLEHRPTLKMPKARMALNGEIAATYFVKAKKLALLKKHKYEVSVSIKRNLFLAPSIKRKLLPNK